ncbi:unnamed protein product [Rotaria socialis]|uniref:Uncharacterized protein n=1 Tax=Rotaria socialis TaxID=392032 RepID=A0A817VXV3_9BILA|nr:unnamed protein product [Rotaria socialis]
MGAMRCITANKWAEIFINGDFDMLMKDECGGKRSDAFFDTYPEIEINAKLFVVDGGAQRPYDRGRDRPDVLAYRDQFFKHFYPKSNNTIWSVPMILPIAIFKLKTQSC